MRTKDFVKLGKYWALAEWHPTHVATATKPTRKARKVARKGSRGRHAELTTNSAVAQKDPPANEG